MEDKLREFVKSLIESGQLSEEKLKEAKQLFETGFGEPEKFNAENCEASPDDVMVFAMIKKLLTLMADTQGDFTKLFTDLMETLKSEGISECALTSVINHIRKLKGLEYSTPDEECYQKYDELLSNSPEVSEVVDPMDITPENISELIIQGRPKTVKFSEGEGLSCVAQFLDQIKSKLSGDEAVECDKAIAYLDSISDITVKKFSVSESDLGKKLLDAGYEVFESDGKFIVRSGEDTLEFTIEANEDGTYNVKFEDEDVDPENIVEYIENKMNSDEGLVVNIDPETGEILQ